MNDETIREAFEKWMLDEGRHDLEQFDGRYADLEVHQHWKTWVEATNTRAQASSPEGDAAEFDFYVAEDGDVFHVMNVTDNGLFVRWYRDDDRDWMDHADFAKARPIRTRSNAKAGEVWMPIETAPKDGTLVILTVQCDDDPVIASWISGSWIANSSFIELRGDTSIHSIIPQFDIIGWMPIPDPMWRIWGRTADSTHDKTKAGERSCGD